MRPTRRPLLRILLAAAVLATPALALAANTVLLEEQRERDPVGHLKPVLPDAESTSSEGAASVSTNRRSGRTRAVDARRRRSATRTHRRRTRAGTRATSGAGGPTSSSSSPSAPTIPVTGRDDVDASEQQASEAEPDTEDEHEDEHEPDHEDDHDEDDD